MALTRDFRETVQADARRDPAFRRGLLREALESLLGGEVALGKELLRYYIHQLQRGFVRACDRRGSCYCLPA